MRLNDIEIGKVYHNGKQGRSLSIREVRDMQRNQYGIGRVRYYQQKGPYSGEEATLGLQSFARWAKGEVQD